MDSFLCCLQAFQGFVNSGVQLFRVSSIGISEVFESKVFVFVRVQGESPGSRSRFRFRLFSVSVFSVLSSGALIFVM